MKSEIILLRLIIRIGGPGQVVGGRRVLGVVVEAVNSLAKGI